MTEGNGKSTDLLERIATGVERIHEQIVGISARIDATNDRLDATNDRLDATNDRLDATRHEMREGFTQVNGRIDNMLAFLGARHGDHEQRIQALEAQVFAKTGSE